MKENLEILAPGGDKDSVKAAILAGADAIYLGLPRFNARIRAENITLEDLGPLARLAQTRGAALFLTLNVLLSDRELSEAVNLAAAAEAAGIKAVIVQDLGLSMLLKEFLPNVSIHASTQMTIHNSAQGELIKNIGIDRVNIARELSLVELSDLIPAMHAHHIKTEVFVHGAFCVSFSGQCYMSSFISGNSGNRGACLQPCRKQYKTLGRDDYSYPLSLKDNGAIGFVRELIALGADSLKIEGRIKNFFYVYTVVTAWRKAVGAAVGTGGETAHKDELQKETEKVFNRGFTTGYLEGSINGAMFTESALAQSLTPMGKVTSYDASKNRLNVEKVGRDTGALAGDCVHIFTRENAFICSAVITNIVSSNSWIIKVTGKLYGKILPGHLAVKPQGFAYMEELKKELDNLQYPPRPLHIAIFGEEGMPLRLCYSAGGAPGSADIREAVVKSGPPLEKASKRSLDTETLFRHLAEGSGFSEMSVTIDSSQLSAGLFIPLSELNRLRREAASILFPGPRTITAADLPAILTHRERKTKILVLCSLGQVPAPALSEVPVVPSVEVSIPEDITKVNGEIPLLPTIIMEKDLRVWENALRANPQSKIITSNTGIGLKASEAGIPWVAGPGANCANAYSFEALRRYAGCTGAFYSPELNREQLKSLMAPVSMETFLPVFGPILMMTTRQAISQKDFATDESTQKRYSGTIRDKAGFPFYVIRRPGWYTELYNGPILFLPEAASLFAHYVDYIVLDLRDFPFFPLSTEQKNAVIRYFSTILSGGKPDKKDLNFLPPVTSGNYRRGLPTG